MSVSSDTTSSGHTTNVGARPPSWAAIGSGGGELGGGDGGGVDLGLAQAAHPSALDRRHPEAVRARTPVRRDRPPRRHAHDDGEHGHPGDRRAEHGRGRRCAAAVSSRRHHPHDGGGQDAQASPPSQTSATSSEGPPTRAAPASGLDAWPKATPPMGRPPKGHVERSASVSTMAPASAAVRPRARLGTTAHASAGARDSTAMSTSPP